MGKEYNDYGRGFYCTEHLELAKEWACNEKIDGYANRYELDTTNLLYAPKKRDTEARKAFFAELDKLYSTLHEASDEKIVDTLNITIERQKSITHLQSLRSAMGYSQRLLAALSQILGCRMEDLMEYNYKKDSTL